LGFMGEAPFLDLLADGKAVAAEDAGFTAATGKG
jgi:hypothetical protein